MSPRSSAPLTLEYILLGLLAGQPMHGYDLHRELQTVEGISKIWSVKQSQLYALLEKLEERDFLRAELTAGEVFAQRKVYHVTPAGWQALQVWASTPVAHTREIRQEFLARLYFAQLAGPAAAADLIQAQRAVGRGWLNRLQEDAHLLEAGQTFERLVSDYRIRQVQAVLDWLEQAAAELRA